MAQQTINIGASPNDGTGTPLRTAFQYTNSNFSELYTAVGPSGNNIVCPGSATITGDLTVDTSTLKVDSANNRVGIGTASPAAELHVVGGANFSDGTTTLRAVSAGNVAYLGTTTTDPLVLRVNNIEQYRIAQLGVFNWYDGAGGTRMTLNSTGLGVGASPQVKLTVRTPHAVATATTYTGGLLIHDEANGIAPHLGAGIAYNGGDQISWIQSNSSTGVYPLALNPAGGEVRIGGNVGIGVTPSAGGGCLQLSSGITFPATQVASSDANTLDDYEEGSWNPVVADASTGGNTGTCTINSAKYVKIGRQVSVQCDISGITTTGMTAGNVFHIRGLPFTSVQGGNGNFYTYRVGRNASTVSSSAFAPDATSHIIFSLFTTNSATTDLLILVSDIVSTSSQIILSVTYFV